MGGLAPDGVFAPYNPFPTLDEPHKAVCWLTRHEAIDEDREADLYLR